MLGSPLPLFSPLFLSPPLSFSALLSPTLPSPPLSGDNNFIDLLDNQLTIHFAFLCKPAWGNATVPPFPLSWYHLGERCSPQNIWGNGVPPRSPSTTPMVIYTIVRKLIKKTSEALDCNLQNRDAEVSITMRIPRWNMMYRNSNISSSILMRLLQLSRWRIPWSA